MKSYRNKSNNRREKETRKIVFGKYSATTNQSKQQAKDSAIKNN